MLNLTQHIEDGLELGVVTGAALMDLTAAYDTTNNRSQLQKPFDLTEDVKLTKFVRTMLSNCCFMVEVNGKKNSLEIAA